MQQNKAYIVGIGPGSPRYLTAEAERVIREAGIVVGWELNFLPVKSLKDVITRQFSWLSVMVIKQ